MSNTVIVIKKSLVSGNVPASLANGELAINTADGKLFYKNSGGIIASIENQNTFPTINANSSLIVATSTSDILSIVPGNNVTITGNTTTKTITISSSGGTSAIADAYVSDVPPSSPVNGELWWNSSTGILSIYYSANSVWVSTSPSSSSPNTFSSFNVNSTIINSSTISDTIYFESNNFVSITANANSKTISISSTDPTANIFTGSSYTLTYHDAGNFVYSNSTSNNIVYVNANTLPINVPVTIVQLGTGYTSVHGNTGTTVVTSSSNTARAQYSTLTLLQPSLNFFIIAGDTA